MKKYLFFIFVFFITSCTSLQVQQLPVQQENIRVFKIEQFNHSTDFTSLIQNPLLLENINITLKQQSLLSIQFSPTQWRWVQTDILGAPLARVVLTQNGWQNDGFIMPNKQAEKLFSALATELNPTTAIFQLSQINIDRHHKIYKLGDQTIWLIQHNQQSFQIILDDNSYWRISEISQGEHHE
ncbi:hypothetical protein [Lonepinella sp. BR2357]|uniref:hypothetical protein n=1 Tax=Lonepinella sp. BR2357 TaxID=3434549 RepID=UPI003F6DB637